MLTCASKRVRSSQTCMAEWVVLIAGVSLAGQVAMWNIVQMLHKASAAARGSLSHGFAKLLVLVAKGLP